MPFTISHALAVLPLATGRPGQRLIPAALVIGSWVPDLPYFVPIPLSSERTHAASGPVTLDLLLGLAVFTLWELVLRRPLTDLAPTPLRQRLPAPAPASLRRWLAAAVSVVLGALTHVSWDTFTHADRWGTTHLAALTRDLAGLPLFKWLQFASGGLGLAGLALWLVLWFRRSERMELPARSGPRGRTAAHVVLAGAAVTAMAFTAALQHHAQASVESTLVAAVTMSISTAAAVVLGIAVVWQLSFGQHPGHGA